MMSLGRKFGFKNLLLLTQRLAKVNKLVWEETNKMFIGSIIGDQRDSILKAYGVDKVVFNKPDGMGGYKQIRVRDLVTTLKKDSHQWVFIDKENRRIGVIETFDAPVG